MKKEIKKCKAGHLSALLLILFSLLLINENVIYASTKTGEQTVGNHSFAVAYGILAVISFIMVMVYSSLGYKRERWIFVLHISVLIVNLGYFALSISKTLDEALLANRISYLGSVFLPLCMFMAIMEICRIRSNRWVNGVLISISIIVFLIAASPGYLDWYYKDAALVEVDGGIVLSKEYGPLHNIYSIYLLLYLAMMIGIVIVAFVRKKIISYKYTMILLCVVLSNVIIWGCEKIYKNQFEFLAISYIIGEIILLLVYRSMKKQGLLQKQSNSYPDEGVVEEAKTTNTIEEVLQNPQWTKRLTAREIDVLREILENKKRKEIAEKLCVTENTVKKHTSHIFAKMEVKNRAELFEKLNIK